MKVYVTDRYVIPVATVNGQETVADSQGLSVVLRRKCSPDLVGCIIQPSDGRLNVYILGRKYPFDAGEVSETREVDISLQHR